MQREPTRARQPEKPVQTSGFSVSICSERKNVSKKFPRFENSRKFREIFAYIDFFKAIRQFYEFNVVPEKSVLDSVVVASEFPATFVELLEVFQRFVHLFVTFSSVCVFVTGFLDGESEWWACKREFSGFCNGFIWFGWTVRS